MRPQGEIRLALKCAAQQLHTECGAFTSVDLAQRAQVGFSVARLTVKDMVRSGELLRVGKSKPEGGRAWRTLFEPANNTVGDAEALALERVMRSWKEFV